MRQEPPTRSQINTEISEVRQLRRVTLGELVAGVVLILTIAGWSWNLSARTSVLESKQEHYDKQLDRIETKVDALVQREYNELKHARVQSEQPQ